MHTSQIHRLEDLTLRYQYFTKKSIDSMQSPYQKPNGLFCKNLKAHPKFKENLKEYQMAKTFLQKNRVNSQRTSLISKLFTEVKQSRLFRARRRTEVQAISTQQSP